MKSAAKNLIVKFVMILAVGALASCAGGGGYSGSRSTSTAATSSAPSAPATTDGPKVKVGILLPLTGQNKALGDAMLNAAQMALFDIGYTNFELIPRDTQGTPAGASEAATAAIASGAQLILGPVFASEVRAAKPIAARANVNMIAFSTDWTLAGGNTFIMGFLPFDQVERLAAYAATQNIRRVGVLTPANAYGSAVDKAFATAAQRTGITITANASFTDSGQNLIPVINNFATAAQTPQAVLMPIGSDQARTAANLLTTNGLPPTSVKRLGTGLFDDLILARDPNLDGAWFAAPSPNLRKRFEDRYQSTYGQSAPRLATLSYDATALATVLAKRGFEQGSAKPAFDRASIANANGFSGIDGIFRFRNSGTAERGLAILEFRNGQIGVIDEAPKTFQALTQ